MSGSFTNYLEDKIVDHIFGSSTYAKPSLYLALYTTSPTDSTSGTEVVGGSYARQTVTFSPSSDGSTSNVLNIDFASMPTCTVVAVGVCDAITSGNLLAYCVLNTSKNVTAGDLFRIPSGELDISLN